MWKIEILNSECPNRYESPNISREYFCNNYGRKYGIMTCEYINCPIYKKERFK